LAAPTYTRGFFVSDIALDGYNTDRVTVNRGPNAILFGVGSAAGVVDTGLIAANLRKNTNKVEYRYGNNDSQRRSFDFNRVLVPDKLGFRLAALDEGRRLIDGRFWCLEGGPYTLESLWDGELVPGG
jgi:outer membrane receptor protein involved in Fe transport